MKLRVGRSVLTLWAMLWAGPTVLDASTVYDFEGFNDLDPAGTIYQPPLTLSAGSVYLSGSVGGTLNEFEAPPLSGLGVFFNGSGSDVFSPIVLTFGTPITSFKAYFTYGGPMTLNFYASGGSLLETLLSQYQTNFALSGEPGSLPNEEIGAVALANAVKVEILAGSQDFISEFVMDDVTVEFQEDGGTTPVPEPKTWAMLGLGLLAIAAPRLRTR